MASRSKILEWEICQLPSEMVEYEISSRGFDPNHSVTRRRNQLVRLLDEDNSEFIPSLPTNENLNVCQQHLSTWHSNLCGKPFSDKIIDCYVTCGKYLLNRLKKITISGEQSIITDGPKLSGLLIATKCFVDKVKTLTPVTEPNVFADLNKSIGNENNFTRTSFHNTDKPQPNPSSSRNNSLPPFTNDLDLTLRQPDDTFINLLSNQKTPTTRNLHTTEASLRNAFHGINISGDKDDNNEFDRQTIHNNSRQQNSSTFRPIINQTSQPNRTRNSEFFSHYNERSSLFNSQPKVEIWKWNLKFSGKSDRDSIPVSEFLRRVDDLAISRRASDDELFMSAAELFEGTALKWYRAGIAAKLFLNWDELRGQLLSDFEGYDYGENLMDYIKNRLQTPSERIVDYFAIMEDLFIKLDFQISEPQKISILRQNLLPEFVRALSLHRVHSVIVLKDMCKALEADFRRTERRMRYNPPEREHENRSVTFSKNNYSSSNDDKSNPFLYERDYSHSTNMNSRGHRNSPNPFHENNRSHDQDSRYNRPQNSNWRSEDKNSFSQDNKSQNGQSSNHYNSNRSNSWDRSRIRSNSNDRNSNRSGSRDREQFARRRDGSPWPRDQDQGRQTPPSGPQSNTQNNSENSLRMPQ